NSVNRQGQVLWARRYGQHSWQFPQGGINPSETAEQAMYRELFEEVGLNRKDVHILASTRNWLRYKLPKRLVRWDTKPVCIGQKQKWYLLQLMCNDADINVQTSSTPPADELHSLLALADPHQVILDAGARSVFLQQLGMEMDLGAIAKGYIADVVRDYLRQQQVEHALINLGGNVQTLGDSGGQAWGVGLKQPFGRDDELIGAINIAGKSVVTSGIYERYFELDGRLYHHILDPQTGYPLDNELLSVTIVCENSIDGISGPL
ncbi:RNA pyrophosphohydrolase, partial [Candidatus Erwinia dacicola]|nr:RNA pyrophosphohydrolase [Candidatus Erwinia dacicola]